MIEIEEKAMKQERGQALIIIAISLVALAAFVGLAIDGGQLYTNRRKVQNGSDAAALAGTRLIAQYVSKCEPGSSGNDSAVRTAVIEYARLNGVDYFAPEGDIEAWYVDKNEGRLGNVGAGSIPNTTTGVEVSLTMTATTSFMKLLGVDSMAASANAVAMTGPILQWGGGALPIAVYHKVVDYLNPGDEFTAYDDDDDYCRDQPCPFSGDHIPNSMHGWLNMSNIYNQAHWTSDGSGTFDRTINNNVGNSGCGNMADPPKQFIGDTGLKGWATQGCIYPLPIFTGNLGTIDGDFIHGEPGARAATVGAIKDTYPIDSVVIIPVFDYTFDPDTMDMTFPDQTPSIGWATGGGGTNASYHHIVGFVAAKIKEVNKGSKMVKVEFVELVIGNNVNLTPGDGINSGVCGGGSGIPDIIAVTLWR
jgi:hypothetical protein